MACSFHLLLICNPPFCCASPPFFLLLFPWVFYSRGFPYLYIVPAPALIYVFSLRVFLHPVVNSLYIGPLAVIPAAFTVAGLVRMNQILGVYNNIFPLITHLFRIFGRVYSHSSINLLPINIWCVLLTALYVCSLIYNRLWASFMVVPSPVIDLLSPLKFAAL